MLTEKQVEAAQAAYIAHVAEHGVDGSSEAMRAAIEAADAAGWEPIDTAPKDGLVVLLSLAGGRICLGWYEDGHMIDGNEASGWTDGAVADWGMEWSRRLHPTHWRPLFAPLEASK